MEHMANRHIGSATWTVLGLLMVVMTTIGGLGAYGTYTNMSTKFSTGTALGVTAAGEGLAAVIALTILGFTRLQLPASKSLHAGLWLLPLAAAITGVVVADTGKERMVFALTPMAMSVSGEAIGAIARGIVKRTTGIDIETQHRNAETARLFTYHAARAREHPEAKIRRRSQKAVWRIAKRIGKGDLALSEALIATYRAQVTQGADQSLLALFGSSSGSTPEFPVPPRPAVAPQRRAETAPETLAAAEFPQVNAPQESVVDVTEPRQELSSAPETQAPKVVETATHAGGAVVEIVVPDSHQRADLREAYLRQQAHAVLWYSTHDREPDLTQAEFCRTHHLNGPYLSRVLKRFPREAVKMTQTPIAG